ncbi:cuticle protein-like [Periplaneta americana]|uniref:cuticle protein-like n=1 Tax=Periplaneta americana TaxID=6978 RepID=UPI0037E97457
MVPGINQTRQVFQTVTNTPKFAVTRMALFKVALLVAVLAVVTYGMPQQGHHHHELPPVEHHVEEHHHAHPKYEFKYGVKDEHTHDIKEQHEKRDGDKVTGYYKLVEPDGTTRIVHYTSDKHTGFHAQVERKGHATHPVHHHHHEVKKVEIPKHHEVEHKVIEIPQHHHEPVYTASSYSNVNTHH